MHPEEVCDVTDTGSLNKLILQPCSINYCASNTLNCKHCGCTGAYSDTEINQVLKRMFCYLAMVCL